MVDFSKLLGYGVGGLGLSLAILAYRLLIAEQKVSRPRASIITSIYVFMGFSVILTLVGLSYEYLRLGIKNNDDRVEAISESVPDQMWYEVSKATRDRLFSGQKPNEYNRGILENNESSRTNILIPSGQCRNYIAMTKSPNRIDVNISSDAPIFQNTLGREMHLVTGRICSGKGPSDTNALLEVTMIKGSGPFIVEAYEPHL